MYGECTGQTNPVKLVNLAKGKMRAKLAALEEALAGEIEPDQQFLLTELLDQLDSLNAAITRVGNEIATWMEGGDAHRIRASVGAKPAPFSIVGAGRAKEDVDLGTSSSPPLHNP